MTQHLHSAVVPGCYRCDISKDEVQIDRVPARELRHDDLLETSAGQWEYVFTVVRHAEQFVAVRTIEGHFTYLIHADHEVQVQR